MKTLDAARAELEAKVKRIDQELAALADKIARLQTAKQEIGKALDALTALSNIPEMADQEIRPKRIKSKVRPVSQPAPAKQKIEPAQEVKPSQSEKSLSFVFEFSRDGRQLSIRRGKFQAIAQAVDERLKAWKLVCNGKVVMIHATEIAGCERWESGLTGGRQFQIMRDCVAAVCTKLVKEGSE